MPVNDVTTAPLPRLSARGAESHKGDYGRALLIGGSRGMSGAISLAGLGALRSGAGLVTLALPRTIQDVVASFSPCYMTYALADAGERIETPKDAPKIDNLLAALPKADVLAVGPGMGRSPALTEFVLRVYQSDSRPLIVDADALFALSQRPDALAQPGGPRVLTPHAGEFARLIGQPVEFAAIIAKASAKDRMRAAVELAQRDATHQTVVVLKGHQTIVADCDHMATNGTGNPGMATGGTGDVLTGVITGLICQGVPPFEAARLGAHVHGLAGDLAAKSVGQTSLIATDVIDFLPAAFQSLEETT